MASRKTVEQFIAESIKVHGNKYDYSNIAYKNNNSKIEIICPEHGPFSVWAKGHYQRKTGCPICGIGALNYIKHTIKNRKTQEQFLEDAKAVHGDTYDYSMCVYVGGKVKMPIICKKHGIFYQHMEGHINAKQGCRKCYWDSKKGRKGESGYCLMYFQTYPEKKEVPAILYVARMQHKNDDFIKIGITTKESIRKRYYFKTKDGTVITSLVEAPKTLYDAFLEETQLLSVLKPFRYYPNRKFGGYTECVKINDEVIAFLEDYFAINISNLLESK